MLSTYCSMPEAAAALHAAKRSANVGRNAPRTAAVFDRLPPRVLRVLIGREHGDTKGDKATLVGEAVRLQL